MQCKREELKSAMQERENGRERERLVDRHRHIEEKRE